MVDIQVSSAVAPIGLEVADLAKIRSQLAGQFRQHLGIDCIRPRKHRGSGHELPDGPCI